MGKAQTKIQMKLEGSPLPKAMLMNSILSDFRAWGKNGNFKYDDINYEQLAKKSVAALEHFKDYWYSVIHHSQKNNIDLYETLNLNEFDELSMSDDMFPGPIRRFCEALTPDIVIEFMNDVNTSGSADIIDEHYHKIDCHFFPGILKIFKENVTVKETHSVNFEDMSSLKNFCEDARNFVNEIDMIMMNICDYYDLSSVYPGIYDIECNFSDITGECPMNTSFKPWLWPRTMDRHCENCECNFAVMCKLIVPCIRDYYDSTKDIDYSSDELRTVHQSTYVLSKYPDGLLPLDKTLEDFRKEIAECFKKYDIPIECEN